MRVRTAEEFATTLVEAAAAVAEVAPHLGDRAARLAASLGDLFTKRHWRARRGSHGDFSAEQVLLADGEAAIVDFDRASCGDPRVDLGNFRARLAYDVLCGLFSEDRAEEAFVTLLEGYRDASDKDVTRRVEHYVAAGLLVGAVEPFRQLQDQWPPRIEALIDRAEELAAAEGRYA